MSSLYECIGLDAHSATSTFAVVDENGQCVLPETVKTSEQSLLFVPSSPWSTEDTSHWMGICTTVSGLLILSKRSFVLRIGSKLCLGLKPFKQMKIVFIKIIWESRNSKIQQQSLSLKNDSIKLSFWNRKKKNTKKFLKKKRAFRETTTTGVQA